MMTRRKNMFVYCSLTVALMFLMKVEISDGSRIHRDTDAAMKEMSNLFHSLFPLVPQQTHYFWKTNQLGTATVQRTPSLKDLEEDEEEVGRGRTLVPWRLQIDFRKRGPDCMRKCITQGVLHPVQCHSLC